MHEVIIHLTDDGRFASCPAWWQNIIFHMEQAPLFTPGKSRHNAVNKFLKNRYQASYTNDGYSPIVIFPNSDAHCACVLEWS
jgi:hypothetical protein